MRRGREPMATVSRSVLSLRLYSHRQSLLQTVDYHAKLWPPKTMKRRRDEQQRPRAELLGSIPRTYVSTAMRALPGAPLVASRARASRTSSRPPSACVLHTHCSAKAGVRGPRPAVKKLYFKRFLFRLPSPPRRQHSLSFCNVPNETLVYLSRAPAKIAYEDEEQTLKSIEFSGKGKISE